MKQFFGKYRGAVVNNVDPENQGRVQVTVPAVLGHEHSGWAWPCVPYAGPGVGFFAIPPVGANVWVEFEGGDPNYPIWSGCFWNRGDAPVQPAVAEMKVFKTDAGLIRVDDTPGAGGITIETTSGLKLIMDTQGIEISNGRGASIVLRQNQVAINEDALEVI